MALPPDKGGPEKGREADQQPGQDGSMEDILASIRRILAEDTSAALPPAAPPPPADDVLDLTEQMLAREPGAAAPLPEAPPAFAAGPAQASGMSAADIDALFEAQRAPTQAAPTQAAPTQAAPTQAPPMSPAEIDALFETGASAPAPEASSARPRPQAASPAAEGGLVETGVAATAAASFAALKAASRGTAQEARPAVPDILLGHGAMTIEQLVREELRPLLKAWLDTNLPPLVERLVKAELDRLTRG
jgi:cell pole-organizing protein PopZ